MAELLKAMQQGVNNRVSDPHSSSTKVLQREVKVCNNICQKNKIFKFYVSSVTHQLITQARLVKNESLACKAKLPSRSPLKK